MAFVTLALAEQATGGDASHNTDRLFPDAPRKGGAATGVGRSVLSLLALSFSDSK